MGSGASTSISPSTSRHDSIADGPKIKLKSSPNRRNPSQSYTEKMMRRPSVFDELARTEDDDYVSPMHIQTFDGDDMEPETKEILIRAVEAFLLVNGTDLRDNVIEIVLKTMSSMVLQSGQSVITQGEVGTSVYIVESGNLQVIVNNERIRKLGPGILFGELALLFDARRSATVTCLDTCKLWSLSRTAFKIIQRNATNLAIMQRTRRFRAVPELACISSTSLTKLMATLTPMSYKSGDALYAAGKCTSKIMLIEEGTVNIIIPVNLQHLSHSELDRVIGIIRPVSVVHQNSQRNLSAAEILKFEESKREAKESGEIATVTVSIGVTEGCVIGMGILLGKIGSTRGWPWVDAKVDGKPYVGAMPPITALAVGTVKTAFFTVCRFERIFGSAEDFYESFFEEEIAAENPNMGRRSSCCHRYEEPAKETQFIPETKYHLESFSRIVPYQSTHMGYYATAIIKDVLTTQRAPVQNIEKKYVLKRLFKSSVCKRMNVKSVLDEAKILELINSVFITRFLGKFQTTDELVFVYEWTPTGDLWNVLHEDEELRDTNGFLSLDITRFYAANIILALEHLHERKIAYRNLKPENILLDATGYIKISCMSFAKVVPFTTPQGDLRVTSFTFCGTLEYLAPEVVLNCGHDQGVDKWALGVLLYEMLTGSKVDAVTLHLHNVQRNFRRRGWDEIDRTMRRKRSCFTPFDPAVRSNYQSLDATTESLEGSKLSKIKISRASSERRMTKELISPRLIDEEVDSPRVQPASCARRTSTDSGTGRSRIHSLSSPAAAILLLSKQSCDGSVTAGQNDVQNGTVEAEPLLSHVTSRSSMRDDWNSRAESGIEWEDTDAEKARKSSTTDRSAKILATIAGLQTTGVDLPHDFSELQSGSAVTSLILQLLNCDPLERPELRKDSVNSIFQNEFFTDFDWSALMSRTMRAPHIPPKEYLENSHSKFSRKSIGDQFVGDDNLFTGF